MDTTTRNTKFRMFPVAVLVRPAAQLRCVHPCQTITVTFASQAAPQKKTRGDFPIVEQGSIMRLGSGSCGGRWSGLTCDEVG